MVMSTGHNNLRILHETTFDEFPQSSIEHFVKDALDEWEAALKEIDLLNKILIEEGILLPEGGATLKV